MMLKRILFVVGGLLTLAVVLFAGFVAFVAYSLNCSDDYPAVLSTLRHTEPITYAQLIRNFSDLVTASLPPGSDVDHAITKLSDGGFTIITDKTGSIGFDPNSVILTWRRRAGVCSEHYTVTLKKDRFGSVENASGSLTPHCL